MSSNPARMFVIGLVAMSILIGIAAVICAIMNPHSVIDYTGGWFGIASGVAGTLIGLFFLFIFIWIIVWFAKSIGWMSEVTDIPHATDGHCGIMMMHSKY